MDQKLNRSDLSVNPEEYNKKWDEQHQKYLKDKAKTMHKEASKINVDSIESDNIESQELLDAIQDIEKSVNKLKKDNVTLSANLKALKDRDKDIKSKISKLNNTTKMDIDTMNELDLAIAERKSLALDIEEYEKQLSKNEVQILKEKELSDSIKIVLRQRKQIYESTKSIIENYDEKKAQYGKYGNAAKIEAEFENAMLKRDIVDEKLQKVYDKAGELDFVDLPQATIDNKQKLREIKSRIENKIKEGTASADDLKRLKKAEDALKKLNQPNPNPNPPVSSTGGSSQPNDVMSVIDELKRLNPTANITIDNIGITNQISSDIPIDQLNLPNGFYVENSTITNKNAVPDDQVISIRALTNIVIDQNIGSAQTTPPTAGGSGDTIDMNEFASKSNLDDFTDQEKNYVRRELGLAEDAPLTIDQIRSVQQKYLQQTVLQAQGSQPATVISTATGGLKNIIDKIKNHKAMVAVAAIIAAATLLGPAGMAALAGKVGTVGAIGGLTYTGNEVAKGRKL